MPDIQMTNEIKDRLRKVGALAYQLKNTWPYVPAAYREKDKEGNYLIPKEHWPVFTLRCIDGVSAANMEDRFSTKITYKTDGSREMSVKSGGVRLETLRLGIVDVKKFCDEDCRAVEFEKDDMSGGVKIDSIKRIPPNLQVEITNAITEQRTLTADELLGLE